jgi:hypothetical protein
MNVVLCATHTHTHTHTHHLSSTGQAYDRLIRYKTINCKHMDTSITTVQVDIFLASI